MTSIITNVAAMTALQTLQATNKMMEENQNRISTGYRVADAKDNAAYWSIATTMRSDNQAMSAVKDSLGIGAATVDTAYTALEFGQGRSQRDQVEADHRHAGRRRPHQGAGRDQPAAGSS